MLSESFCSTLLSPLLLDTSTHVRDKQQAHLWRSHLERCHKARTTVNRVGKDSSECSHERECRLIGRNIGSWKQTSVGECCLLYTRYRTCTLPHRCFITSRSLLALNRGRRSLSSFGLALINCKLNFSTAVACQKTRLSHYASFPDLRMLKAPKLEGVDSHVLFTHSICLIQYPTTLWRDLVNTCSWHWTGSL